jgi:hypothetical protein
MLDTAAAPTGALATTAMAVINPTLDAAVRCSTNHSGHSPGQSIDCLTVRMGF